MHSEAKKVALITGASRGIGRAVAVALAKSGCYTLLNYRSRQADADAVLSEIQRGGYTLPRPTTLKEKQTKQVPLLDAPALKVGKEYVLRGGGGYYRGPWHARDAKEKVQVFLMFRNSEAGGLGQALPKGVVRVYKRDKAGSPQFVGEDRIDHTPKDEQIRLELGNAFDIAAERRQSDYQQVSPRVSQESYEIKLRNHKKQDVTVLVSEPQWSDWEITESTHPHTRKDARTAEWNVPGHVFRLKGKGFHRRQGSGSGDQLCRIVVEVPSKQTSRQRELLQEFEALSGADAAPITKGFFDKVKEVFGEKAKK